MPGKPGQSPGRHHGGAPKRAAESETISWKNSRARAEARRAPTATARGRSRAAGAPSAVEGRRARAQHLARRRVRRPDRLDPHRPGLGSVSRRVSLARGPAQTSVSMGQAALGRRSAREPWASRGAPGDHHGARRASPGARDRAESRRRAATRGTGAHAHRRRQVRAADAVERPGADVVSSPDGRPGRRESADTPQRPRPPRRHDALGRHPAGVRVGSGSALARPAKPHRRRQPEISTNARARAAGLTGRATGAAGPRVLPAAELRGPDRAARDPRDLLAGRAGRQGDDRALAAAGSRRRAVPAADLRRCAAQGRARRDLREPPRVPLRAIPLVGYRGRARAGPGAASADGRRRPRRTDRGQSGRPGIPALSAALADAPGDAVDDRRGALLLQLRGPRRLAERPHRVLRTQGRERLPRAGRSSSAGNRGILQSLRRTQQSRRVVDRGRRERGRGGAHHRGHSRGNGMDRGVVSESAGHTRRLRVAIIGAGPSGSALAILLAREGAAVTLFDDGRRPGLLVGESLVPAVVPILQRLGLEEETASFSRVKPGVSFIWSPNDRFSFSFARFAPGVFPYAYNIPRPQFDDAVLAKAIASGVDYVTGRAQLVPNTSAEAPAELQLSPATLRSAPALSGEQPELIVDATGRARLAARALGIPARLGPRKDVAHFAHFEGCRWDDVPGQVRIARGEAGWSWCIPLQERLSIGIVLGQDDAARLGRTPEERLERAIAADPGLPFIAGQRRRVTDVATYANYQLISERGFGRGWVMVGDSFGFVDPMLSPGVFLALRSSEQLADALTPWLRRRAIPSPAQLDSVLTSYAASQTAMLTAWLELVAYLYDGRLAALIQAGKAWMPDNPGAGQRASQTHIAEHVGLLASRAAPTSRYSRGLLRFLGRYRFPRGDPPES